MSTFLLIVTLPLAALFAAAGLYALTTARMPLPWLRRSVHRPRLWGAGSLVMAVAVGTLRITPFEVGMTLILAGLVPTALSQLLGAQGDGGHGGHGH
ncbi:hypothetical protein [Streptomyces vilmorinianum]|uniref:hypothetical protein n=1 Tax=Streptomyces vilmorinianum TaxID=3051092 RepID=UPI0010FB9093|nr:hypothetical protein [Streptomyces vilmorinianum]